MSPDANAAASSDSDSAMPGAAAAGEGEGGGMGSTSICISSAFKEGTWVVIQQDDTKKPLPRYEQGAEMMGSLLYVIGGHYGEKAWGLKMYNSRIAGIVCRRDGLHVHLHTVMLKKIRVDDVDSRACTFGR